MKNIIFGCTLCVFFIMAVNANETEIIEKIYEVESNSHFSLHNINGEVDIASWQEQRIKIEATITANNLKELNSVKIKSQQDDGKVIVETSYEDNTNWQNNQTAKVTYKVWLPKETNLSDVALVNGSLRIENVAGEIEAEVVNGSVIATGLSKDSEITSVNGSVKVYYEAINTALRNIEIDTVNGSIKLYLPADIDANLDLETMHGSIKTDFGIHSQENLFTGQHLRGDIGSGDIDINMESVNGSIKVLKNVKD